VGIGLTTACNADCPHCYSRGAPRRDIDPGLVMGLVDALDVESVNLGTGESFLHPDYAAIVETLTDRGIDLALTTNGASVEALDDRLLSRLHDVDFSLDFPDETDHDRWRYPGSFASVVAGLRRCRELGVTASVAMCLSAANHDRVRGMTDLCGSLGASLRINFYKPVHDRSLMPGYEQFWGAVWTMAESGALASCSEPVVTAAMQAAGSDVEGAGSPCGRRSFRVRPDGELLPCVYWNRTGMYLQDVVAGSRSISEVLRIANCAEPPAECDGCPWLQACMGGCLGRRLYTGLDRRDVYCFVDREPPLPGPVELPRGAASRWVHSGYLCTMILDPELAGDGS
jgi:radical SAM protein with 4Fe4S-binding SPASM domain